MESEPDLFLLDSIFLAAFSVSTLLAIVLVILLLAASALISSSEVAFFSLTPNDFKDLEEENSASSNRIIQLKDKPRRLLATILISNNFINVAIALVLDFIFRQFITEAMTDAWAESICSLMTFLDAAWVSSAIHFAITVGAVTFLLVLFGEVMPKVYAKVNNVYLAKLMSGTLLILMRIFNPFSSLLVNGTSIIENRLASRSQNGNQASREDIDKAIDLTVKDQKHAKEDSDILKGIVKFGDVAVKQIMRSRVDVMAVDFKASYKELIKLIKESGYSRIPVYDEDFDHVTGILYVKDLLGHLQEGEDFEWQELIRTNVFYVPEAKKIDDLLREFQQQRLHLAIVVDEYGGSAGIVTLEDIMEEIIGDIRDEFDDEVEVDYRKIDDYNYIFEGKTLINDVCRVIGMDTTTFDAVRGDSDSLAGLVLELKGQIPKKGIEVDWEDFGFKVVAVNKRRIEEIRITLPQNIERRLSDHA